MWLYFSASLHALEPSLLFVFSLTILPLYMTWRFVPQPGTPWHFSGSPLINSFHLCLSTEVLREDSAPLWGGIQVTQHKTTHWWTCLMSGVHPGLSPGGVGSYGQIPSHLELWAETDRKIPGSTNTSKGIFPHPHPRNLLYTFFTSPLIPDSFASLSLC
jgi:hypothetical protein